MDLRRSTGGGVFERYRARLFGIVYRILGSIADAEDVLQTTYLRWHTGDTAGLRNPESWLMAVATRLSIDRLRSASRERERSAGAWLSEPIASPLDDAEQRSLLSADLSMAFGVLLERLSPEERAAFLLRDVFEADYGELARVLDGTEVSCRQRSTAPGSTSATTDAGGIDLVEQEETSCGASSRACSRATRLGCSRSLPSGSRQLLYRTATWAWCALRHGTSRPRDLRLVWDGRRPRSRAADMRFRSGAARLVQVWDPIFAARHGCF